MVDKVRFSFTELDQSMGVLSTMPYLPLVLRIQNRSLNVSGLVDTGASVNVLPYEIGLRLGASWERQTLALSLSGNLARFEARALIVTAIVHNFPPVDLVFAWTMDRNARLILGHVNFFQAFDVCCYTSKLAFEISPVTP